LNGRSGSSSVDHLLATKGSGDIERSLEPAGPLWIAWPPLVVDPSAVKDVKGCRTPARTCGNAATYIGVRAGVGQASREETAACAAVGIEGYGVMAI